MKHKTAELEGALLDAAVARIDKEAMRATGMSASMMRMKERSPKEWHAARMACFRDCQPLLDQKTRLYSRMVMPNFLLHEDGRIEQLPPQIPDNIKELIDMLDDQIRRVCEHYGFARPGL